ncbi:WW domain-containing oxidoreductase-like, partial [Cherax quadricarinatus]|uniref:WW domain-containing oxidoreductase-like n=1 Tax=Cherax quadricarinatus TaxID=27406 RepID=UPI00387E3A3E
MEIPETDSEDEMAPGWEERCTTDGLVFYAHHATKTTQWHHPRTNKKKRVTGELPFGWERQITEEGKVFFVDHLNHKTTYTDPRLAFAVEESKSLTDLRQRFDSSTTGIQILHGRDLTGRIAIVTGANCGIGKALYTHLVVFARIGSQLLALKIVYKVHTRFVECRCDVLLLNAGVFGLPHTLTEDGLETTFQVNHLSQFYLALLLQPLLVQSTPARVIFVSSESHRFATLNTENISEDLLSPSHKSSYTSIIAYCNTKLCNVLTALEMQRRFGDQGINCYAVHPGNAVSTYLTRHWWAYRLLYAVVRPFTKSLVRSVKPTLF